MMGKLACSKIDLNILASLSASIGRPEGVVKVRAAAKRNLISA